MRIRLWLFILVLVVLMTGCATDSETKETQSNSSDEVTFKEGKVVSVKDKTFYEEDLDFHTLMNKIKLLLQKEVTEDEEQLEYLDEQIEYHDNINVNLQSMIELYAAALLAEEKNYFIPDDKLLKEVGKYKEQIDEADEAVEMVEDFGREKFNRNIEEYVRQTLLRDRVVADLEENLKEDNPDAEDREINFYLAKEYDDLIEDQIATLEIEIHIE